MAKKCKVCKKVKDTVKTVIDPYMEDLYDKKEKITICPECLTDRREDI